MKLKIAILGTRGIPNHYGGFEQITEYLSAGLAQIGHEVTVYNSHNHPNKQNWWNGVRIVHCYDLEYLMGTAGQFIYDLNCIWHSRKQNYDVILFMGYTSSSVWAGLFPKNSVVISNMDGLEWKREKYSTPTRYFLKLAEKLAVKYSHFHIADSKAIQRYLNQKYSINARYIPYGAFQNPETNDTALSHFNLSKKEYFLLMARMEPENNIEMILDGFHKSSVDKRFITIGNIKNKFGQYLVNKFNNDSRIQFAGGIFDKKIVNSLSAHCSIYFHGHSVGGTNPSLLEAMANNALIAAHNNEFNKSVLENNAYYFSSALDVQKIVNKTCYNGKEKKMVFENKQKIKALYNWQKVINEYDEFLCECYKNYNL
jgi:glycosyltransferase involved in cell wall biosynthesis